MKRFVFVPFGLQEDEKVLNEAKEISYSNNIGIRFGEIDEFPNIKNVDIIFVPDILSMSFEPKVKCNFLQLINYSNDFTKMNKNFKCKVKSDKKEYFFYPTIAEKYCLKFRFRIESLGQYEFAIIDEEDNVISDKYFFEVV